MSWTNPSDQSSGHVLSASDWNAVIDNFTALGAYGTSLPASGLVDSYPYTLVDSTSAPTYAWRFLYNLAAAKWVFVGGTRYKVTPANASSASGNGVWEDKGTMFTFPRAGLYEIEISGTQGGNSAASSSTYGVGFSSPPALQASISWNLGGAAATGGG